MNYKHIHDTIITNAKSQDRNFALGLYERHHILPKSLGGTNKSYNIVCLTFREHFIIHKLLVKIYDGVDKQKMCCALKRFVHSKHGKYSVKAKDYERIKIMHRIAVSQMLTGIKRSDITKLKMSEGQRRRYKQKSSHWIGKTHSENTKVLMSLKQSKENNPQFCKTRTPEERKAISDKMKGVSKTDETKRRMSEGQILAWKKKKLLKLNGKSGKNDI
jgi:hypothetical protein